MARASLLSSSSPLFRLHHSSKRFLSKFAQNTADPVKKESDSAMAKEEKPISRSVVKRAGSKSGSSSSITVDDDKTAQFDDNGSRTYGKHDLDAVLRLIEFEARKTEAD